MQALSKKLRHRVLHKFVRDGLFRLILIGGLRRKAVCHQHQTVGHVLKRDLRFRLRVFVRRLEIRVDGVDERVFGRLLRRTAILEPRRVVIVLEAVDLVRKAQRRRNFHLVFWLILAVAALALGLPELRHRERLILGQLADIIENAVFIVKVRRLKLPGRGLVAEAERHARVHDRLPLERIFVVFLGDIDVREHVEIGKPAERGAGLFPVGGLLFELPDNFAPLKVERVFKPVAPDHGVKIARGILRRARAEAV